MTLSDYVSALKRGWSVILVAFVLALVCGTALVLGRSHSPVYTTSARLYVETVAPGPGVANASPTVDLAMSRAASYAFLLGGKDVAEQVAATLGGRGDESVSVIAPPGTVLIEITVTSGRADRAVDVAQAYADIAPEVLEVLDENQEGEPRIRVSTVDEPGEPTAPAAPSRIPILVAAGLLGLGLGVSIVLVRETLRRERSVPM